MAPKETGDVGAECYYEALGVPFEATDEEIRHVYHGIVRTLHPDRRRPGSGGGDALERFHQVQSAWRCLSDPTRRLLYDLRNFGRSSLAVKGAGLQDDNEGQTAEEKLVRLQREQATLDIGNMEVVLQKVLRRERATRGIIIKKALYGDLRLREECLPEGLKGLQPIEEKDLVGPVVDVAVALQCLVEQHTIVIPGGACSSKADLPGFYNPAPLDTQVELSLYVLYEFRGQLHEVIVGDRETLSLPFRKHAVPTTKAPRGPFSPANITSLRPAHATAGAGVRAAAGVGAGMGKATSNRGSISGEIGPAEALRKAVSAYTLQRFSSREPGDASSHEFLLVGLAVAVAAAFSLNSVREVQPGPQYWLAPALGLGAYFLASRLWAGVLGE